jgi:hypothetical protein
MTYLKYDISVEQPKPDEQAAITGIISGMTQQSQTVERREGHAVRASHAKSTGLVVGTLAIPNDLPTELAQGLFAESRSHPVAIRFAQGPGETLGDRVSTHRGMAIKVFGATGDKLEGHAAEVQDFVLASGTTFPSGTAQGFLRDGAVIGKAAALPEGIKSAVSSAARSFDRALHAFGMASPFADFFGHPFGHPLADAYFSQAPIRFGDYVAKIGVFPTSAAQDALREWRLEPHTDENGFRHAFVDFVREHDAIFELRAQLWADAETQPIEDASIEWPESESRYRTIATITIPSQDAYSPARQRYFEQMTFSPAHSLREHKPLGSVMRARLQVYQALSAFRHGENGVVEALPANIADIPA